MLVDTLTSLPLDLLTSLVWLLLLSLLLEDFMLELDVMLPTLLEPSMSPRGRLRLMLTMELDTDWDMLDTLVSDMLVSDTLDWDMLVLDTLFWDTMLVDTLTSLPLDL